MPSDVDAYFRTLDWDSEFFGYPVASIASIIQTEAQLIHVLNDLRKRNFRLAYFFSRSLVLSEATLKAYNGLLADEKITFTKKILKPALHQKTQVTSYPLGAVNAPLLQLAYESGEYSRFRIDPHFSESEFKRLYTEWIVKSVNRQNADEVFVFQQRDTLQGMVTVGTEAGVGKIGLIAVAAGARGQGVGRQLIEKAESYFFQNGVATLQVTTQKANRAAMGFYLSNGFEILCEVPCYHFWLNERPG